MTLSGERGTGAIAFRAVSYPLRLYCGAGALDNLAAEIRRHDARRAFVICSRSIAQRTDLLDRISGQLGDLYAGAFDRMDKDSSYPAVLAARDAARDAGADLIVAVGGGSVIVGARGTVILLAEKGDPYELMTQYPEGKPAVSPRLLAPKLPIINIPTTPTSAMNRAGTGLKNDDLDHRMEFFDPKTRPVALFWDAAALLTAPLSLARSTGTTTFTGCLQGVAAAATANPLNPLVEGDNLQAFRLASRALPRLVREPENPDPRIELCAAAFLMNRAADDGAGRGRQRSAGVAYALATALHIRYDHVGQGEATSAVLPEVLRRMAATDGDVAARTAEALGVARDGASSDATAEAAADALAAFYRSIGMPARVRDLQIPESDLPLVARDTLKNFNANPGDRPADYADRMLDMLRACW